MELSFFYHRCITRSSNTPLLDCWSNDFTGSTNPSVNIWRGMFRTMPNIAGSKHAYVCVTNEFGKLRIQEGYFHKSIIY